MTDSHERPTTDLAMQLLREGKVEECLHCLDRIVQAYPDNALAYSIMGAAYAKSGDKGMAIASFERALAEEESARAHSNLGKAYESVERIPEAIQQYEHAVQMEPGYQQAVDGLQRLKPPDQQEVTAQVDTYHHAHQLGGGDPGPVDPSGLKQVGIPVVAPPPPPPPGRLPDLRDLEYRARQTDEKAKAVQRKMLVSGLIYGVIVGPICMFAALFLCRMFPLTAIGFFVDGIGGIILGAIIGGYTGFTSGDDWDGAKVGAVLGGVVLGGFSVGVIINAVFGALAGGVTGLFIARVVNASIGWD